MPPRLHPPGSSAFASAPAAQAGPIRCHRQARRFRQHPPAPRPTLAGRPGPDVQASLKVKLGSRLDCNADAQYWLDETLVATRMGLRYTHFTRIRLRYRFGIARRPMLGHPISILRPWHPCHSHRSSCREPRVLTRCPHRDTVASCGAVSGSIGCARKGMSGHGEMPRGNPSSVRDRVGAGV